MAAAADLDRGGGEVILPVGLAATLAVPGGAPALVVFAHGGGSGRFSPRNRRVAAWLRQAELGTLMDLLTADEERIDRRTAELRFDIDLLAERLVAAADWLASEPATRDLGLGLFGASTAAAATGADPERLRGIPAIGRSVSGAIRGTQSEGECADDRAPRPRPDPHAPGGGVTRAVAVGGLGRSTRGP